MANTVKNIRHQISSRSLLFCQVALLFCREALLFCQVALLLTRGRHFLRGIERHYEAKVFSPCKPCLPKHSRVRRGTRINYFTSLFVFHLLISFNNSSQHQHTNLKTVLNRVVGKISDNQIIFKLVY
jgi:hypothetical protein